MIKWLYAMQLSFFTEKITKWGMSPVAATELFALTPFAMLTVILRTKKKIQSKIYQQADFDHSLYHGELQPLISYFRY